MSTMRATALILLVPLLSGLTGCFNTYQVPADEFRKLQSTTAVAEDGKLAEKYKDQPEVLTRLVNRAEADPVTVTSVKSEQVSVTRDTKIFVRSQGGRRYQLTPFNFSMVSSQLVASDRDTLLPLADLASFEVDHLSTGKTVGLLSVGVIAAVGVTVAIFTLAGEKSVGGQ